MLARRSGAAHWLTPRHARQKTETDTAPRQAGRRALGGRRLEEARISKAYLVGAWERFPSFTVMAICMRHEMMNVITCR